ncbi:PREDICTED: katanin p80 WD40 repeat-containing subunit B1 homolog [Brassica oleracea var. oleracea]|uniref:katanin p80 WD40 repeat-containing subunit B1 homolog n=1 Tax=Brassica oleracea var. oleracea TaxID=109376 RepID=UPI0006A6EF54|nr:PREDICTED: katanin p80 WD40 repeat-containing subunit B1 homolog [Brassica oleracea var. oleracea]
MKDLGAPMKILGMEIFRDREKDLFLSQKAYINEALTRLMISSDKPICISCTANVHLTTYMRNASGTSGAEKRIWYIWHLKVHLIWDIRKKGCIQTYKGHTRGISTVKFTPDGRWLVSGGLDNVVKVWDITAGKLLHEFKFHDGPIRSLDSHPLEFLLATGSADRTVKF